jgi:hypothetical protein
VSATTGLGVGVAVGVAVGDGVAVEDGVAVGVGLWEDLFCSTRPAIEFHASGSVGAQAVRAKDKAIVKIFEPLSMMRPQNPIEKS